MKGKFLWIIVLLLLLAGCNSIKETGVSEDGDQRQISIPVVGEMEIPASPERVVLMRAMDAGNAALLGADIAGVNDSVKNSDYLDDMGEVTYLEYGDIESLRALKPDLIITFSGDDYIEEYENIAPTIPLNYQSDRLNKFRERIYLNQLLFLGVILNEEEQAEQLGFDWIDSLSSYRRELNVNAEDSDALVLVQDDTEEQFYVYGPYQSYGTEAVYDVFGFNISDSVQDLISEGPIVERTMEDFKNTEADYIFVSVKDPDQQNTLKSQFAETLGVDESHVILLKHDDYVANDLQSIEEQSRDIIEKLK